jgi:Leucine-rich repeat (LRR) protein
LTELNLDNNTIVSLPNEAGQLRKLKVLSLRNNYIHIVKNNPQPIPSSVFVNTLLIDLNLHGNNELSSTELISFNGFDVFLERRKKVKTKNLYGGAISDDDTGLCGLK